MKNNKEMLNDLDEAFPNDPEILRAKTMMVIAPENELLAKFIEQVYPHKKSIVKPDEKFFLEKQNEIFSMFAPGHFGKLWSQKQMDKDKIWEYFQISVSLVDKIQSLSI